MSAPRVYLVGAGPGDPRWLTARALEVLGRAQLLIHDPRISDEVLSLAPGADRVHADYPPGSQAVLAARAGKVTVRLYVGDPMLFGGADVEAEELSRAGIPFEIVPGIPEVLALGDAAGVALTRSTDASPTVAFARVVDRGLEAHDWSKLAVATDVLVIAAPPPVVTELVHSLVFYGRAPHEPAALIADAGLPAQRVLSAALDGLGRQAGSWAGAAREVTLVVGPAVERRAQRAWLERLPLFGRRVVVTRAREQGGAAAALLREHGAMPILVPAIAVHPPADAQPLVAAIARLPGGFDWLVFTSANGVEHTWRELRRQGKDARALGGVRIAAIGPATARALEPYGLVADLVAKEHRGEGLAAELLQAMAPRQRVLLSRAKEAREVLPVDLAAAGHAVEVVAAYETRGAAAEVAAGLAAQLESGAVDAVLFTSSSTVKSVCALLGPHAPELLGRTCVASIGPITSDTAAAAGVRVDVTAEAFTLEGLVRALCVRFAPR